MTASHSVQTCRWGTPTLFASWPYWFDASRYEWSCTRGAEPLVLEDTGICARCRDWAPDVAETGSVPARPTSLPAMVTRRDVR